MLKGILGALAVAGLAACIQNRVETACGGGGSKAACRKLADTLTNDSRWCAQATPSERVEHHRRPDCAEVDRERDEARRRAGLAAPEVEEREAAAAKLAEKRKQLGLTDGDPSIEEIRRTTPTTFAGPFGGARGPETDEEFVSAYLQRKKQGPPQTPPQTEAAEPVKREADTRAAVCAATKAAGFPVGTFGGDRTRSASVAGGDCESTSWFSLHVAADADGCITWHAMSRDELACKSGRSVPTMCVERGTATAERSGTAFALATTVESKASGGAPARYHVWRCGEKRVRTDMKVDLRPKCVALGSDANPVEERVGDVVCQHVRLFDDGGTVSVVKDGLRVTKKGGEVLTLTRVDATE